MEELIENEARIPESVIINGVTYVIKDTPELQKFFTESNTYWWGKCR